MTATMKPECTTDRFDEVAKYAGRTVCMVTDWQLGSVARGVMEMEDGSGCFGPADSVHIQFDRLGLWIVPCEFITLPGELWRFTSTFAPVRSDFTSLDTIGFIVRGEPIEP